MEGQHPTPDAAPARQLGTSPSDSQPIAGGGGSSWGDAAPPQQAPVQADDSAQRHVPSHERTIKPQYAGLVESAIDAAKTTPGALASDAASSGIRAYNDAANAAYAGARLAPGAKKVLPLRDGAKSTDPSRDANPFHVDEASWVDPATNPVHEGIRQLGEFTILQGTIGKLLPSADAFTKMAAGATVQTVGSNPYEKDVLTNIAAKVPVVGPIVAGALASNPSDPEWYAYSKSEARNLLSFSLMEGIFTSAGRVAAAARGMSPESIRRVKLPEDAASIEPNESGGFKVTPKAPVLTKLGENAAEGKINYQVEHQGQTYSLSLTKADEGKTLKVDWLGKAPEIRKETEGLPVVDVSDQGAKGTLGPSGVLSMAKQLAEEHPEAQTLEALHVGGAHAGGATAPSRISIDLNRFRAPSANPTEGLPMIDTEAPPEEDENGGLTGLVTPRTAEADAGDRLARQPLSDEEKGAQTFPDRATAEVEVAARNQQQVQLLQAGDATTPPDLTTAHKDAITAVAKAIEHGAHQDVIAGILRATDAPWPYYLQPEHLQGYIEDMADVVRRSRGDFVKSDMERLQNAAKLFDPETPPAQTIQQFANVFGDLKGLDDRMTAARIYLQGLGSELTKLGEALTVAPNSPTAVANLQQAWTTALHFYTSFRAGASEVGRALRALRPDLAPGAEGDTSAAAKVLEPEQREQAQAALTELKEAKSAHLSANRDTESVTADDFRLARARAKAQKILKTLEAGPQEDVNDTDPVKAYTQRTQNAMDIHTAASDQRESPLTASPDDAKLAKDLRPTARNPVNEISQSMDREETALEKLLTEHPIDTAGPQLGPKDPTLDQRLGTSQNPVEKFASQNDALSLNPQELSTLARQLRIANQDPTEVLEAVRQSIMDKQLGLTEKIASGKALSSTTDQTIKSASTYMINNMISGPTTLVKVAVSQAIMSAKLPAEYLVGGIVDPTLSFAERGEMLNKGWDIASGQIQATGDAIKAAARAFRAGDSAIDPKGTALPDGAINPDVLDLGRFNWLHTLATVPQRTHTTVTEFSKVLNYRAMVTMRSLADSRAQGLTSEQAAQALADDLKVSFDPNGKAIVNADALYEARRATFTLPLQEGTLGKGISDLLADHPVVRMLVAPFQHIATNIFRENWSMMPGLNFLQKQFRSDMQAGGERGSRAMAQMMFGASITGFAAHMAASGQLTGRGPRDPELRKQMTDNGWQPYALTIGGHSFNLTSLEPFGMLAQIPADLHDALGPLSDKIAAAKRFNDEAKQPPKVDGTKSPVIQHLMSVGDWYDATRGSDSDDGLRVMFGLAASVSSAAMSKTYMKSATDVLDAWQSQDAQKGMNWFANESTSLVPGSKFWEHVTNDGTQREVHGMMDKLYQSVPGYSNTLEAHRNLFGEKRVQPPGFLDWANGHVNPFLISKPDNDPVQAELLHLGKAMPMPTKQTKGADGLATIDWTDRKKWDQDGGQQSPYDRSLEIMSQPIFAGAEGKRVNARDAVTQFMNSDSYKNLPPITTLDADGPRYQAVAQLLQGFNKIAQQRMMQEDRYKNFARAVLGANVVREVGKTGVDSLVHAAHHAIMNSDPHQSLTSMTQ